MKHYFKKSELENLKADEFITLEISITKGSLLAILGESEKLRFTDYSCFLGTFFVQKIGNFFKQGLLHVVIGDEFFDEFESQSKKIG